MEIKEWMSLNLQELQHQFDQLSTQNGEEIGRQLLLAQRVFVCGAGRTGLIMEMFAMRLMQLGLTAYIVGDATTPAIRKGDLLLVGSGSGETTGVIRTAARAKQAGALVGGITTRPESTLGQSGNCCVILPGRTKDAASAVSSRFPLGTEFEQMLFLFLDALAAWLMEELSQSESLMRERHANLE